MRKGVTGERMVFLVVAVCLGLFVLWFLLSRIAPSLLQQLNWLLGFDKPTNIELATMCAIYRCANGCMYMRVQEISWKSGGETVKCQENACGDTLQPDAYDQEPCTCKLVLGNVKDNYKCGGFCENGGTLCDPNGNDCKEKIDTNLKVCNPNYPVTITLKGNEKIDLSHFALGSSEIKDPDCIIPSGSLSTGIVETISLILLVSTSPIGIPVIAGGSLNKNIIIVDSSLIKSYGEKEDCLVPGLTVSISHDSVKELVIGPKSGSQDIEITTKTDDFVLFKVMTTYVNAK